MPKACREKADAKGISLIKRMEVKNESMISNLITKQLAINISILIGANKSTEVVIAYYKIV